MVVLLLAQMKKWILEILLLSFSFSTLPSLHGEEILPDGAQVVVEIEADYQKGTYKDFLTQLHKQYERAGKAGLLKAIFEKAKTKGRKKFDDPKVLEALAKYKQTMKLLDEKRNTLLKEAIQEQPDLDIARRVQAVVSFPSDPEHKQLLDEFEKHKFKIPENPVGSLESKIAALENEFYMKSLLLDVAAVRAKKAVKFNKKKVVLMLEKLSKMENVAKSFKDSYWQSKLDRAKEAFHAENVYKIELDNLESLAQGKVEAKNDVEQKVKEIMMDYLQEKTSSFKPVAEIVQK